MTCISAFSSATSLPGLNWSMWVAWRFSAWPRGSITISVAPRLAACLKKVAATGWFSVGLAPITTITSASFAAVNGAVTAPEPMFSSSAATEEAWHSRVQWSTLLEPKPVRTSFWNRYASSLEPLAEPKPASARGPSCRGCRAGRGGDVERLLPARLAEMGQGVGRVDGRGRRLWRAVLADQRPGQPVGVGDVVEAEAALDAQPVLVGRAVATGDVADLVVLDVVGDLAADAAVGADALDLAIDLGWPLARASTIAAGIRAPVGQAWTHSPQATQVDGPIGSSWSNTILACGVAVRHADHVIDLDLAAGAHAEIAVDAGVQIDRHRRVAEVGRRRSRLGKRLAPHPLGPLPEPRIGWCATARSGWSASSSSITMRARFSRVPKT